MRLRHAWWLLLLITALPAHADKAYKWVDKDGRITYHDRPPPEGSGYRVEEKSFIGERPAPKASAAEAAEKSPVVLYAIPKCPSCDLARLHLQNRKVPFTEKNVESDPKAQAELKQKAGTLFVPTLAVGERVLRGYLESLLEQELDRAGYPRPGAEAKAEEENKEEKK